jgi:hypothetical protein
MQLDAEITIWCMGECGSGQVLWKADARALWSRVLWSSDPDAVTPPPSEERVKRLARKHGYRYVRKHRQWMCGECAKKYEAAR